TAIYEADDGDVWLASEGGVTHVHDGVFTSYSTRDGLPHPVVNGISGDDEGHIWVLANRQIFQWTSGRFVEAALDARAVPFTRSGWNSDVFFGVDDTSLYRFTRGHLDRWPLPASLRGRTNERIAQDQSGLIWIGVGENGLVTIRDGHVRETYTASQLMDTTA